MAGSGGFLSFLGWKARVSDNGQLDLTPGVEGSCVDVGPIPLSTSAPTLVCDKDPDRLFCVIFNESKTDDVRIGGKTINSNQGFLLPARTGWAFDLCNGPLYAVAVTGAPNVSMMLEIKKKVFGQ